MQCFNKEEAKKKNKSNKCLLSAEQNLDEHQSMTTIKVDHCLTKA